MPLCASSWSRGGGAPPDYSAISSSSPAQVGPPPEPVQIAVAAPLDQPSGVRVVTVTRAPGDKLGLDLRQDAESGAIVIGKVFPGYVCARAGVVEGEALISLNGVPTSSLRVGEVYDLVRRQAGPTMTMELMALA